MKRRSILAGLALALALPVAARAETLSLNAISSYLNQITTAQGAFTQVNADGTLSTGTIYIKRPGRIRFEYNPPEQALVMAGGGQVAVFDPKSDEGVERYPLNQTPLSIILQRNVDFSRAGMVTGHGGDGTRTTVRAQDPDHPEYGYIDLVFTDNPTELRQWIVTDETGQQTTVILGDLSQGVSLPEQLFGILGEMDRRGIAD